MYAIHCIYIYIYIYRFITGSYIDRWIIFPVNLILLNLVFKLQNILRN